MKFVHISDVYLGAQPDPGREWSETRKKELYESFDRIVKICVEEKAGLLMIAGNLFCDRLTGIRHRVDLDGILRDGRTAAPDLLQRVEVGAQGESALPAQVGYQLLHAVGRRAPAVDTYFGGSLGLEV